MNNEKIIIEGEIKYKKLSKILIFILPLFSFLLWIFAIYLISKGVDYYIPTSYTDLYEFCDIRIPPIILSILTICSVIFYFYINQMSLFVTNKRLYGKVGFGRVLDLPINKISFVNLWCDYISISGLNNEFYYPFVKNKSEVFLEINKLIEQRNETIFKLNGEIVKWANSIVDRMLIRWVIYDIEEWNDKTPKIPKKIYIHNVEYDFFQGLKELKKIEYEYHRGRCEKLGKITFNIDENEYITKIYIN